MTEVTSTDATDHGVDLSLETKLWRLSMIISAAGRIHSSLALSSVLDTFLDVAVGEVGALGGRVFLLDAGDHNPSLKHSRGRRADACPRSVPRSTCSPPAGG